MCISCICKCIDCSRPSSTTPPTTPHRPTSPTTPESTRHSARTADRMRRYQMTDPDHRRRGNNSRSIPSTPPPPQPTFQAIPAANISQAHISDVHKIPVVTLAGSAASTVQPSGSGVSVAARPPVSDDPFRIPSAVASGVDYQFLAGSNIPQVQLLPDRQYAPLHSPVPLRPPVTGMPSVNDIPQVQLPENWNAPLQNPIPVVPPAPVLQSRGRGRGRRQPPTGPFHDLSGDQANPAWNNLHRGHIAYREQRALYECLDQGRLKRAENEQLERKEQARLQRLQVEMLRQEPMRREEEQQQRETAEHIRHLQSIYQNLAIEQRRHYEHTRQEEE